MISTIDRAGRIVVPKRLREDLGLLPGPVEIVADGAGIRVSPLPDIDLDDLVEVDGKLLLPAGATGGLSTAELRELRLADQR